MAKSLYDQDGINERLLESSPEYLGIKPPRNRRTVTASEFADACRKVAAECDFVRDHDGQQLTLDDIIWVLKRLAAEVESE
jgi:hypothetical protein